MNGFLQNVDTVIKTKLYNMSLQSQIYGQLFTVNKQHSTQLLPTKRNILRCVDMCWNQCR